MFDIIIEFCFFVLTWLGDLDSNQDKQIQSLLSYH